MKSKNRIVAATVLIFSLMSQNVFAIVKEDGKDIEQSFVIEGKKEVGKVDKNKQETNNNKPNTTNKPESSEEHSVEKVPHTTTLVGTFKRPYYITLRTPKGDMNTLKSKVNTAMNSVGENDTSGSTYKKPAVETTTTTQTVNVPDYIEYASNPFFVRYVYSTIKITAKNTTVKKTTSKDKYYKWSLSGPKSWTQESANTSITLRFSEPGTYKLSVVPFEERTVTTSGSSSASAYESWPAAYKRPSETIYSTSKTIPATTTVVVAENNARRKEWVIEITSADINIDIPIIPPPPGTDPSDPLDGIVPDITIVE